MFKQIMNTTIENIAPIKEIRVKTRTEPWMTGNIFDMIKQRDNMYYKWKKNKPNNEYYKQFCNLRNKTQRAIKQAKSDYFGNKIEENKNDSKKLWSCLKNLGYSNKCQDKSNIVLKVDEKLCYDTTTVADYVNRFFTIIATKLVSKLPDITSVFGVESQKVRDFYTDKGIPESVFKLQPVTHDFIYKELSSINSRKSTGLDGISPRFIKDGAEILKEPIGFIVNLSIETCNVPDDLKNRKSHSFVQEKLKIRSR